MKRKSNNAFKTLKEGIKSHYALEGIHYTTNTNGGTDGHILRRLKRTAIVVFENFLRSLTFFQSSFLLFVTFDIICLEDIFV